MRPGGEVQGRWGRGEEGGRKGTKSGGKEGKIDEETERRKAGEDEWKGRETG